MNNPFVAILNKINEKNEKENNEKVQETVQETIQETKIREPQIHDDDMLLQKLSIREGGEPFTSKPTFPAKFVLQIYDMLKDNYLIQDDDIKKTFIDFPAVYSLCYEVSKRIIEFSAASLEDGDIISAHDNPELTREQLEKFWALNLPVEEDMLNLLNDEIKSNVPFFDYTYDDFFKFYEKIDKLLDGYEEKINNELGKNPHIFKRLSKMQLDEIKDEVQDAASGKLCHFNINKGTFSYSDLNFSKPEIYQFISKRLEMHEIRNKILGRHQDEINKAEFKGERYYEDCGIFNVKECYTKDVIEPFFSDLDCNDTYSELRSQMIDMYYEACDKYSLIDLPYYKYESALSNLQQEDIREFSEELEKEGYEKDDVAKITNIHSHYLLACNRLYDENPVCKLVPDRPAYEPYQEKIDKITDEYETVKEKKPVEILDERPLNEILETTNEILKTTQEKEQTHDKSPSQNRFESIVYRNQEQEQEIEA